uniref:Uncharacterized protein n=1 Tax=Lactuca sativa TaxID=4236 RepID=A0A9R1VZL6_LACSA|nr:hypothetical protein LSAT_V11C300120890 [Lactuca sativa]
MELYIEIVFLYDGNFYVHGNGVWSRIVKSWRFIHEKGLSHIGNNAGNSFWKDILCGAILMASRFHSLPQKDRNPIMLVKDHYYNGKWV